MWGIKLSEVTFNEIMRLTERHPYYVNYICDALWSEIATPEPETVLITWGIIVDEERSDLLSEFYSLTENQKKLLVYLSSEHAGKIYTIEASKRMGMPSTSVTKALHVLLNRDIVEESSKGIYRVINPA